MWAVGALHSALIHHGQGHGNQAQSMGAVRLEA